MPGRNKPILIGGDQHRKIKRDRVHTDQFGLSAESHATSRGYGIHIDGT